MLSVQLSALAALLSLAPQDQLEGLRPDEGVQQLSKVPAPDALTEYPESDWIGVRVIDALSGEPIPGALLEICGEDYYAAREAVLPLRSVLTAADGTAYVLRDSGRAESSIVELDGVGLDKLEPEPWEKYRISAAGYRSTTEALVELGGDIALWKPQPLSMRFLDLDGQPIPGAVLRSDQSCSHAPPAFVGIADQDGRLDLGSFPPLIDGAEARMRAPGFASFDAFEVGNLAWPLAAQHEAQVFLPRVAPIRQKLLTAAGTPVVEGRLLIPDDPWFVARIEAGGFITIDSRGSWSIPSGARYLPAAGMREGVQMPLFPHARGGCAVARIDAWEGAGWQGEKAVVDIRFGGAHAELAASHPPEVTFINHLGYDGQDPGDGSVTMPVGTYTVLVGGDFSGWRQQQLEIELGAEGLKLMLQPKPEARLSFDSPLPFDISIAFDVVQAGEDSRPMFSAFEGTATYVPHGRDVTLFWLIGEAATGAAWRLPLGIVNGDRRVDMSQAKCVRAALDTENWPKVELLVELTGTAAQPATKGTPPAVHESSQLHGSSQLFVGDTWIKDQRFSPQGTARYSLPQDLPYQGSVQAEGFQTQRFEGVAGLKSTQRIHLRKLATIRMTGRTVVALIGGRTFNARELAEGAPIPAGAHRLTLIDAHGQRIAADLMCAAGEERELHW